VDYQRVAARAIEPGERQHVGTHIKGSVEITSMAGVSTVPPYPITKSRPALCVSRIPSSLAARNWWYRKASGEPWQGWIRVMP
jgi:hypothetical protein